MLQLAKQISLSNRGKSNTAALQGSVKLTRGVAGFGTKSLVLSKIGNNFPTFTGKSVSHLYPKPILFAS